MNRNERRAAKKQRSPADQARALFSEAFQAQDAGDFDAAIRLYKRGLASDPSNAKALNNLGSAYLAQGKRRDASERFRQAIALHPQTLDGFTQIAAILASVCPELAEASQRAVSDWPKRLPAADLFGEDGVAAVVDEPLFAFILTSTVIRDTGIEYALTGLRREAMQAISTTANAAASEAIVGFWCALARQCFINEYVFSELPDEQQWVANLRRDVEAALASGGALAPLQIAMLASYVPLHTLSGAPTLASRKWPQPVRALIRQQVDEPLEEQEIKATIPRLTDIDDEISKKVRDQYEENPYPRWVLSAAMAPPITVDSDLRDSYPTAAFTVMGPRKPLDILVAGCGTGRNAIELSQKYLDARVLAIDLSLSSLAYARRATPAALADIISYAQADILKLGGIGRMFDVIDSQGVLHHMRDPFEGWRALLALLRPGGIMGVGLYSAEARRAVVEARKLIAQQGLQPQLDDIRRCRELVRQRPDLEVVSTSGDFFSASDARDLMFHVQEVQLTVPDIKRFLSENRLNFIGFKLNPDLSQACQAAFAAAGRSIRNLDHWDAYECAHPETFRGMYQFTVQKA